ncbi:MAG: hypothetical protein DSY58_04310 [Desulfobulbus sp.]|nr:MAG: hypothetical protein DSY58_04310 [Desulfobulbus sp.]
MKQKNPFLLKEYSIDEPYCGRNEEQKYLADYARELKHTVLYSPRRTGKTALIKRVQKTLSQEGAVCIYVDFFGVVSVDDIAVRLAQAVFAETRSRETLFRRAVKAIECFRPITDNNPLQSEKQADTRVELAQGQVSGVDLLEIVLRSLGKFIYESSELVHFALDEFQEITTLAKAEQIETLLHDHIHRHAAAYTFIGSRRTVLCRMFTTASRPFFQEAVLVELPGVPAGKMASFIARQFASQGKICDPEIAEQLVSAVSCFPYYCRKLACIVFEYSHNEVTAEDVENGISLLLMYEEPFFEGVFLGLAPGQIALLRAIAREPVKSIFAKDFLRRHRLGSIGGAQGARKKMVMLDMIEFRQQKWWIVDPVLEQWLVKNRVHAC